MSKSSAANNLSIRCLTRQLFLMVLPFLLASAIILGLSMMGSRQVWEVHPPGSLPSSALLLLAAVLLLNTAITWLASWRIAIPLAKLATAMRSILWGGIEERSLSTMRSGLSGLFGLCNQLADEYRSQYQSLTLSMRSSHSHALEQIAEAATNAQKTSDLLPKALEIISHSFSCAFAGVYLPETGLEHQLRPLILQQAYLLPGSDLADLEHAQADWLVGGVNAPNSESLIDQALIAEKALLSEMSAYPGMVEAAIPMIYQGHPVGVLRLCAQTGLSDPSFFPFSPHSLPELEKIAGFLAFSAQAYPDGAPSGDQTRQSGSVANPFQECALLLYRASSRIGQSETAEDAISFALQALQQTPYPAAVLLAADPSKNGSLQVFYSSEHHRLLGKDKEPFLLDPDLISTGFMPSVPLQVSALSSASLPPPLLQISSRLGSTSAVYLPVLRSGLLRAMLILGEPIPISGDTRLLAPEDMDPWFNLIEALAETLEKLHTQAATQRQIAELQAIWKLSQAISLETDLDTLFQTIHRQVEGVMGELNSFAISLYDAQAGIIRIPYMIEEGRMLEIAPFPLGEGLTSILVRTQKPLLLEDDVEAKSLALGAKLQGQPAKSWLGVPMLHSGEVVGAMIVQDIQQAKRFGQDDVRLLSAIASQIAVVIRNARLLEETRQRADREALSANISATIWSSSNLDTILRKTLQQLGSSLDAVQGSIELWPEAISSTPAAPPDALHRPFTGNQL